MVIFGFVTLILFSSTTEPKIILNVSLKVLIFKCEMLYKNISSITLAKSIKIHLQKSSPLNKLSKVNTTKKTLAIYGKFN